MSETVIFIIGSIVWAITVAGVVLAGGYLLGVRDPGRARENRPSPGESGLED